MPAKAGNQNSHEDWLTAFAGMTLKNKKLNRRFPQMDADQFGMTQQHLR